MLVRPPYKLSYCLFPFDLVCYWCRRDGPASADYWLLFGVWGWFSVFVYVLINIVSVAVDGYDPGLLLWARSRSIRYSRYLHCLNRYCVLLCYHFRQPNLPLVRNMYWSWTVLRTLLTAAARLGRHLCISRWVFIYLFMEEAELHAVFRKSLLMETAALSMMRVMVLVAMRR